MAQSKNKHTLSIQHLPNTYLPKAVFNPVSLTFICTRCGGRVMNYLDSQYVKKFKNLADEADDASCIQCGRTYQRCEYGK